jgi:hypothetical protein
MGTRSGDTRLGYKKEKIALATNQEKVTRGVIYVFTRVILFVIAILIIALGFFTGMNSMNVNVIVKDAFELREKYVLQPTGLSNDDLSNLFTQDFISSDPVLNSTSYQEYDVSDYYQRANVDGAIVWPWLDTVTVHATENVMDIEGTLSDTENAAAPSASASPAAKTSATAQQQIAAVDQTPPEWKSAEYDVTLVKDANTSSWKVQEMHMIKEVQPVINQPSMTPSPSQSAKSAVKPSASAQATASPSAKASASVSAKPTKSAK